MTSKRREANGALWTAGDESATRRPYVQPRLVIYGSLRGLTFGSPGGNNESGSGGTKKDSSSFFGEEYFLP